MTGYQQGILWSIGSNQGDRFIVRNIDKFYINAVADLFNTHPYFQKRKCDNKKDYWCIKSSTVKQILLYDVSDYIGFISAIIELQSCLKLSTRKRKDGSHYYRPALIIYGTKETLDFVQSFLPIKSKKIQTIRTNTGTTHSINITSLADLDSIYNYCYHYNSDFWNRFDDLLNGKLNDENHPW